MTQRELERQLAQITGESLTTIRRRGFNLIEPPDLEPLTVDWDEVQAQRTAVFPERGPRARAA